MVAALLAALRVVGLQVLLRLHLAHRGDLLVPHGGDVDVDRRGEVAQLGLVGLEQEQLRRLDRPERARDARARRQRTRTVHRGVRHRMIGVERVGVRVGDQDVGRELADRVGDRQQLVAADLQRVVAEVQAAEGCAEMRRRRLGLGVPEPLDVLDRLALVLPQLAGLAALAVGQRDHLRLAAQRHRLGHGAAGAPDEVGGVRPEHLDPLRHRPASGCSRPPWFESPPR